MSKKLIGISDGIFSLEETENPKVFYFYRNDGKVLGDIGRAPMDLYQAYITHKMMSGEITEPVMNNILHEISEDGRTMRMTIYEMGEKLPGEAKEKQKVAKDEEHVSLVKRIVKCILGR